MGIDFIPDAPATAGATPAPADGISFTPDAPQSETAGRVAGLTGRALAAGTAGLARAANAASEVAGLPSFGDSSPSVTDLVTGQQPYKPQLSDFVHPDKWQQAAEFFADKAGLAKPETPGERIYSKAVEAVPTAALTPEALLPAALSAAAGGAASQGVAEAGGGPGAQAIAGLAAGGAPALGAGAAGLTRTLARGAGEDAAAQVAARQAAAQESGTTLTVGQATGNRTLQKVERVSGMGWGGGPIHAAADQQAEALGEHVDSIVKNLSRGAEVSPTAAGEAANAGAAATRAAMKQAENTAYGEVDKLVPAQTPINVQGTLAKLDALAAPTPGAEATTAALVPPKIAALRENLAADAAKNNGTLPYSAVRALRTRIGNEISPVPSDPVANGALKALYSSLSDDLNAGVSAVSPEAKAAADNASSLYKANVARRDAIDAIVDKAGGPEAVYTAATSGLKSGATKVGTVMGAMNPEQQNVFRATVIDRLGRAPAGQQGAAGDVFNPSTFLTSWSKIAPEAKNALFGKSGEAGSLRAGLDSLTGTLETLRNSQALKNPSGSADAVAHAALGVELITKALHGVGSAASAGLAVGANNILARALVNPRTVRWLATTTKLPASAIPGAVNALAKMGQATGDPDARDLAAALRQ